MSMTVSVRENEKLEFKAGVYIKIHSRRNSKRNRGLL